MPMGASPLPHDAAGFEIGRELGSIRLLAELGRGASGIVYLGQDKLLGREVAVKVLLGATLRPDRDSGQLDPAATIALQRFFEEARVAASAARHPNLTQIYHADVEDGLPYLVMEYVRGANLRTLLDHAGPLGVNAALVIMSGVTEALIELHGRGVVHRDIKPANVLLDPRGTVFVTDFGLAVRGVSQTTLGVTSADEELSMTGTPAYIAPEAFDGRIAPRSDIYALGVMAFQLLTARLPFEGTFEEVRRQHLEKALPVEQLHERGVPDELIAVIERATHKQAIFRYKTIGDFARAMRQASPTTDRDLAAARTELTGLVAQCLGGGEHRKHASLLEASPPTSYPDVISRFADQRREKRLQPALGILDLPKPPESAVPSPKVVFAQPTPEKGSKTLLIAIVILAVLTALVVAIVLLAQLV